MIFSRWLFLQIQEFIHLFRSRKPTNLESSGLTWRRPWLAAVLRCCELKGLVQCKCSSPILVIYCYVVWVVWTINQFIINYSNEIIDNQSCSMLMNTYRYHYFHLRSNLLPFLHELHPHFTPTLHSHTPGFSFMNFQLSPRRRMS